jgi:hypothetical protein
MTIEPNTIALEILDRLNASGNNYTAKTIDLNDYGTSFEITERNSGKKLWVTPVEGNLIDMILYDKAGNTIATSTLFDKAVTDLTSPEDLANLIAIYF